MTKLKQSSQSQITTKTIKFKTNFDTNLNRNWIVFGAPGTGKSYTLQQKILELFAKQESTLESDQTDNHDLDYKKYYERVTFHPDYSYAHFVGSYKPVMITEDNTDNENIQSVIRVLTDPNLKAQQKYDKLFDKFVVEQNISRLPILVALYSDDADNFKAKPSKDNNNYNEDKTVDASVQINAGKSIRTYVNKKSLSTQNKEISYEYVPGPFIKTLVKALKSAMIDESPKPYLLLIEEINRANVAAVFGEVFQLLDRGDNGVSEYEITTSNDLRKYLSKELGVSESEVETIKIPNNMFIWSTMNTADQGVFPMDTAFKRRWNFTYLGIDENDQNLREVYINFPSKGKDKLEPVEWNSLRKAINNFLSQEKINEDKQLGPYFIKIPQQNGEVDHQKFLDHFKNKILMYLFEDAIKQKRQKLFSGCSDANRYSKICSEFDKNGIEIFNESILKEYKLIKPNQDLNQNLNQNSNQNFNPTNSDN